jgi:hypothetical protein
VLQPNVRRTLGVGSLIVIGVVSTVFIVRCSSKSTCEKYADRSAKCGDPYSGRDLVLEVCEKAEKSESPAIRRVLAEAECAEKHTDCVGYKA